MERLATARGDEERRRLERLARQGDKDSLRALRTAQTRAGLPWSIAHEGERELLLSDIEGLCDSAIGSQGELDGAYLRMLEPVVRDLGWVVEDLVRRCREAFVLEQQGPFSETDWERHVGVQQMREQVLNASLWQVAAYLWHRDQVMKEE
jgi:hypothetical protein